MSPSVHKELRVTEAARVLGVHENTIRNAIKRFETSGGEEGLRATLKPGPWGKDQYAIHLGVFRAWALARYGREVAEEEVEAVLAEREGQPSIVPAPVTSPETITLYERLLEAQTIASRAQAIEASTEDIRGVLETHIGELRERLAHTEEQLAAAQRALLQRRSLWGWLRGGNGDPAEPSDKGMEEATKGA